MGIEHRLHARCAGLGGHSHEGHEHAAGLGRPFAFSSSPRHFERARPFAIEHIAMDLALDFETRSIHGSATIEIRRIDPSLLVALAESPLPKAADAGDTRQRAFSLLVHAYDAVRRAVTFVRGRSETRTPLLLRLHGVFGACHRGRARVVPKPPTASATKSCASKRDVPCGGGTGEPPIRSSASKRETSPAIGGGDGAAALALPVHHALDASSLLAAGGAELVAPNVLSLLHWGVSSKDDAHDE